MIGKYLIFKPDTKGNFSEEWRQCLKKIIYRRETGFRLVKLNIFADLTDFGTYNKVKKEVGKTLADAFGNERPVFNITIHPPEIPWKVAVEAGYSFSDVADIVFSSWNSIPYIVCQTDSGKEVWSAGLGSEFITNDTRNSAEGAFEQMKAILDAEGMSFNNLIRQWNYIGNILDIKDGFQKYQIFNEVRNEFYQKYRSVTGYPAATGIGMKLGGVLIDFCAVQLNNTASIKPINNPNQVNAYEYGQQVLKGATNAGSSVKHPPQFERALLFTEKVTSTLFISGTASIKGQDTIGIGNVGEQTLVTIENISKLTDQKRIDQKIINNDIDWGKFILLRVYVKNQEDFGKVEEICGERFPGVPQIFIESDICRDNLLVEIEAEFLINN